MGNLTALFSNRFQTALPIWCATSPKRSVRTYKPDLHPTPCLPAPCRVLTVVTCRVPLADEFDPLSLLRCQLEASEVERDGEILALNRTGLDTPLKELARLLANGDDPLKFLVRAAAVSTVDVKGDCLEFTTAVLLLKCGVNGVRRSVRLKVQPNHGGKLSPPHAEIDLLFNRGGRLWLVDCKDRRPAENLIDGLWPFIQPRAKVPGSQASRLIGRIGTELGMSQTKVLKEDLLAIREIGGLLGRALCVRRDRLPVEVEQY